MLVSSITMALVLAPLAALARPTATATQPDPLIEYYASLERRDASTSDDSWPFQSNCDLAMASMPVAPTPLPSPLSGQTLSTVVLGRGTQNYTCDPSTPHAAPEAVGAVATLFNASCIASTFPGLLQLMPSVALQFPVPDVDARDESNPASLLLSGHHYFIAADTPYFDLDTPEHRYGKVAAAKADESDPPADASKGVNGHGSVAWLRLTATQADYSYKTIYRVNTAGGSPPKTCQGMPKTFTVDYAAEYWMWD